jgi:hypothetical protein
MTPPYALAPMIPYLKALEQKHYDNHLAFTIWEPACGTGMLSDELSSNNFSVFSTDIESNFVDLNALADFFTKHPIDSQFQLTNPPYGIKAKWIIRSFELGTPFALLVPVETLAITRLHPYFKKYGFEVMLLDNRIDFKMPDIDNWLDSSSQFPTMWLCHGILPEKTMFGSIKDEKQAFLNQEKTRLGFGPEISVNQAKKILQAKRKAEKEAKENGNTDSGRKVA